MEGKTLCELHHIQGRHRQKRQKVPESLKMQRKKRKTKAFEKNKFEIRAKLLKLAKPMKRKRVIGGESEALDEAVRKMKLKRGDLPLELIRMVLKREIEKKKRKESDCSDFDEDDEEEKGDLMRELPNGLMAISSSSPHFDNAGSCSGSGSGSGSVSGSLVGSIKELNCKCPNRRKICLPGIYLSDKKSVRISKKNYGCRYFDPSASLPSRKAPDASVPISCPPTEFGGCGDGLLDLRCILPLGWFKELEISAEEIVGSYELPEAFDTFSCCSLCLGTDYEAIGVKQLQEAARRENSNDNFLFYPSIMNIHADNLEHFQKHWGKGHPVIVRNVLPDTLDLSWDPIFLFYSYLKNSVAKSENEELAKTTLCLDWFEVEIGIKQLFLGSLRGLTQSNMCDEKLKLKGWLSSQLFEEQFPDHFNEIIRALPLREYMDPRSGLLNIAARLPLEITKPDIGPSVSISYSSGEELVQANSVTKLCYGLCDVVNVLAHATDAPVSMKQLNKIRKLMKRKKSQDQMEHAKTTTDQHITSKVKGKSLPRGEKKEAVGLNDIISKDMHSHNRVQKLSSRLPSAVHEAHNLGFEDRDVYPEKEDSSDSESDSDCNSNSEDAIRPRHTIHCSETLENEEVVGERTELAPSCGAEWDVFRRQDVPKLMEYLRKHSNEFSHTCSFRKHVVHPILDQNLFLDTSHKIRLKEEYEIEPWTFEQHVGEAVIVPAGCPYQIRNVKSCVNVVLDFVSPENVTECIRLIDELRLLPEDHKAKAEKFEVEKMALYRISAAIKEIRELTCAESSAELGEWLRIQEQ
ncbi:hypothetical protein DITRI_Ditri02bG0023600 [Diplodiscus trichospermus]